MTVDQAETAAAGRPILILGAFGSFGRRVLDALARTTDLPLIAAGRRIPSRLPGLWDGVNALAIDVATLSGGDLRQLNPALVIDTVGPFQSRDRRLAKICVGLGIHYIDLGDGREFVESVDELDDAARRHGVLVVSGASTVPALSSAVIDFLAPAFAAVEEIEIGIAPGYLGPRGLATIRSILGYTGRAIPIWRNAKIARAYGWSNTQRYRYPPPVGLRYLSVVDVPDTALIPHKLPRLTQLSIRAGLEVPLMHHMLCGLGFLVRLGLIRDLARHAPALRRFASWFDGFGSDNGAMHVQLRGPDAHGHPHTCTWTLIAEHGDGPQIPATAAVVLAKKLLRVPGYSPIDIRGAMPALSLLSLQEFECEWRSLSIRSVVSTGAPAGLARQAARAISRAP
jgi:Saccharopine dehydrogenase NADP binding domain